MDKDIKDDLQDSLDLLKSDKFKQGHGYKNNVIKDISGVLDRFEQNPEHIPQQEKLVDDCRACIFYTLCIDDGMSLCGADIVF